jgi:hypothetical protein
MVAHPGAQGKARAGCLLLWSHRLANRNSGLHRAVVKVLLLRSANVRAGVHEALNFVCEFQASSPERHG